MTTTTLYAHPHDLLVCGRAMIAEPLSAGVLPNGLYSERYDTNHDGKIDVETYSTILGSTVVGDTVTVEHAEHPSFYIIDKDYDGQPEMVYLDKGGNGKCQEIVPYKDLRVPEPEKPKGLL